MDCIRQDSNMLDKQIIDCLCSDYQSVWIVDLKDLSMKIYKYSTQDVIKGSVDAAVSLNSYEDARKWYAENYVDESDYDRIIEQTSVDNILEHIKDGMPYFVEYKRNNNSISNYNQLFYAKIPSNGAATHFILGFRNIDVRRKAEIDDLTGIYIRSVFIRNAEAMIKNNPDKDYQLIISDIVDFKQINEDYGIKIGDEILRVVGEHLRDQINGRNVIGRYGGDQFVVLATPEDMEDITAAVNRVEGNFAERGLPPINVKFGIYNNIKSDDSMITVCDRAHIALNSIKHQYGKIAAVYDETLRNELRVQRQIEKSMRSSLEAGDFKVYYQPKHDTVTEKLVGAEALVRWIHPEYGFLSPAEFIPIFERNGFIVEIDRFVWNRTCENINKWRSQGIDTVPISVNASRLTFVQPDMVERMQNTVETHNITPEQVHVEITETLMTTDIAALVEKMTNIRSLGYQIELDDFGAGYSSINILSTLPIDVVKLDMSFMKQFGDNKRIKVLEACINLAKNLGFKTVSEGVEEKRQRELLNKLGVDIIQGYYYSKPIPEEEFEEYMKAHA